MQDREILYKMALTMLPKIGAITAKRLISYLGSPEAVFREKKSHLQKIPGIGEYLSARVSLEQGMKEAELELSNMQKSGIRYTYYEDEDYPTRLKQCEDGPLILYYRGSPRFNSKKLLSVVGTRNATQYGKEICGKIIRELSGRHSELVVVSGLAYGIDIMAHRFALEYQLDTFAVMAHGLNTIYPSVHSGTARKIVSQGALLSDFHSSIKPERNNFLRRNRIIAGLSDASLIVQSGPKGGALITADIASSYNREVLSIPGKVGDLYSSGCNSLIKQNVAALVESARDIEALMNWDIEEEQDIEEHRKEVSGLNREEKLVISCLEKEEGLGHEILGVRTGIPVQQLSAILLQMELRDWIAVLPGKQYKSLVCLSE